jgi:WD40 repeat protein
MIPVDVSADGRAAALRQRHPAQDEDVFTVWDLTTGREQPASPLVFGRVHWARFSPDGSRLAFHDLSRPAVIRMWNVTVGKNLPDLTGLLRGSQEFFDPSGSTFFSPDGSLVAAMAGQKVVGIWDVDSGHCVAMLKDNELPNLRYHEPQANFDWAALQDNQIQVWSRDGRWLTTIGREDVHNNRVVKLWEVSPGPATYQLESAVDSLSLDEDGKRLAANAMLWDVEREHGRALLKRSSLQTEGRFAVFTQRGLWAVDAKQPPNQTWFARGRLADAPEPVRIRQLAPATKELSVPNPHGLSCLDVSPDGRLAVVCREDPKARKGLIDVWDLIEGRKLAEWKSAGVAVSDMEFRVMRYFLRFGADGKRLVTCTNEGAEVWDVATGRRFPVPKFVEQHSGGGTYYGPPFFPAALSPDGNRVFIGMFGSSPSAKQNEVRGVIGVADVETGSMIGIWKEHRGAIWSLAVSPDGKVLASGGAARVSGWTGGDDLTIHLWEVPTGRELARWHAHDGGVTALVFSRDGQTLFSGGGDGSLKVWDLSGLRKELTRLGFE